jgi:hypothetical protein
VGLLAISFILSTLVGGLVGKSKGRTGAGVTLGVLLGWLGVLITVCLPPTIEEKTRRAQEQMAIWAVAQQRHQMIPSQVSSGQIVPQPTAGSFGVASPEVQQVWQQWGDK